MTQLTTLSRYIKVRFLSIFNWHLSDPSTKGGLDNPPGEFTIHTCALLPTTFTALYFLRLHREQGAREIGPAV